MKFEKSKILALAVSMALVVTGCSKDENSSAQSESSTEKDLPTSSGFIDVSSDVYDSSLNSYDTSKPIDVVDSVDSSTNSSTSSDGSSLTDDKSQGDTNPSSQGDTSSSDSNSQSPSSSSDGNTSSNDDSTSITVTNEEFKAVFGYDIPEGATEVTKDGYWLNGVHTASEAALAAREEAMRRAEEAIKNGTYGKVTPEQAADLDKIFLALKLAVPNSMLLFFR